jgi:MoxR-like ATPase
LTKFTNPEEVFGPLSLQALERDEYFRIVKGYLPASNIAFLDEIFKANSAILNALLGILNERRFDNGNSQITVPLLMTVAASNEIPTSDELEALYDRFLIRKEVLPVSDREINNLLLLPMSSTTLPSVALTEEFISETHKLSNDVSIPQEVLDIIRELRIYLRDESDPPIYISDRRLLKSVNLLKISAVTNGRRYVSLVDTLLLTNILWYNPDERKMIRSFILKKMIPDTQSYRFIYDSLKNTIIKSLEDSSSSISSQVFELESLSSIIGKKIVMLRSLLIRDFNHHRWISSTDLIQLRQQLGPKISSNADDLEKLMININIVITALNTETNNRLEILQKVERLSKLSSTFSLKSSELFEDDDNSNDDDDDNDAIILSSLELSYTKKEAMKLLSKERYQIWKKKTKKKGIKKNKNSDDDDDDY